MQHYELTLLAERNLDEIAAYTEATWGKDQKNKYLIELHHAAEYLGKNHQKLTKRYDLSGTAELCVYPVRSHYIVYVSIGDDRIAIVALIEQSGRHLPDILIEWSYQIREDLDLIRDMVKRREFSKRRLQRNSKKVLDKRPRRFGPFDPWSCL